MKTKKPAQLSDTTINAINGGFTAVKYFTLFIIAVFIFAMIA